MNGEFCTFIHQKCEIEGLLSFEGTTRIDGRLKGRIFSRHLLIVGPTGVIEGDLRVGSIIVYGKVKGTISAEQRVEAKGKAELLAEIHAPVVQLDEGVSFEGKVQMSLTST
jgi:cytoskeletal protein CcmA (bactofilin family)